jgi:translation initiation factor 5A
LAKTSSEIKNLKPNGFVLIDDAPCRVEKVQVSSTGKHGHSKVRLDVVGLLDGVRRNIIKPADETVDVPIVEKKKAQVLSIMGNKAQIMDLADYSTFELEIPEERKEEVKQGEEIDYFEVCDIKTLKALK